MTDCVPGETVGTRRSLILVPTIFVGTYFRALLRSVTIMYIQMTRSRYKILENEFPYFLTSTVVEWFPVFSDPIVAQTVLDSLKFLQENSRMTIYAYVIMENHLHVVASSSDLSKEFGNFKSFTAHRIIGHYKDTHSVEMLRRLRKAKKTYKKDSEFQFWQAGSHPKQIQSRNMMKQKIEYIHHNPVRRGYIEDPSHWRYSSAGNYVNGTGLIPVCTDW